MVDTRRITGTLGEQAATDAIAEQGYEILHRNYRVRNGELDIVAMQDGVLVFLEVKTRTSNAFGLPEEAVNHRKQKRLRLLASEYLRRERPNTRGMRFDVISVAMNAGIITELRHIVNAF